MSRASNGNRPDYFSDESLRQGLKQKTVRGGAINVAAQAANVLIGLAAIPILARLLEPDDFGLVGMVAVFTNFARMFVDAGLPMATIQRENITRQQVSNMFWFATGLGLVVGACMAGVSPLIALFYGEPRLVAITVALSLSFVMSGLTLQHQALLRRGMQYKELMVVSVAATLVSQIVAVIWAWRYQKTDDDYWALVLLPITMAAVRMMGTWWACRWRPTWYRRSAGTREMLTFGSNLLGFNFINYFARNLDKLLIGWWWGKTSLGYYDRAYRLLLMPMQQVAPAFTSVTVPMLSRLRSDPDQYRRAYFTAVRPLVWVNIPTVGLLYTVAEPLVLLYLGEKWAEVVPLFRALTPAAWASSFVVCSGWAFVSWGHVNEQLKWGVIHSIVVASVIASCAPWGALPVAYGVSAAYVVLRLPGFYFAFRGTPLGIGELGRLVLRPTVATAGAVTVSSVVAQRWFGGLPVAAELPFLVAIYAVAFLATATITPGALKDLRQLREVSKLLGRRG